MIYKTTKERRIYKELLKEYKDDKGMIHMIEKIAKDEMDKRTWEQVKKDCYTLS